MENKKSSRKSIIWTCVSILLAVLTVRVILKHNSSLSFDSLVEKAGSSDKRFIFIAFVSAALYVFFEGCALRYILKRAGYKRSHLKSLLYSTSDVYFSAITPSATGGQPASAFFMLKDDIPGGTVTATLLLNLIMYTLSVVVLGVVALLVCPAGFESFGTSSKILILIGFVCLSALSVIFVLLLKNGNVIFRPLNKIIDFLNRKNIIKNREAAQERLTKIRDDYQNCADMISNSRSILFYTFLWNLLQRVAQITVPSLVYGAFGGRISDMIRLFFKQCLVTIGYNCIPIPGGMGVSDFLMIDGFQTVMGETMAYTVELISRGITFYICVSVSGIITLIGYLAKKRSKEKNEY